MSANPARLSINQMTVRQASIKELVQLCSKHGIGHVGLWRDPVSRTGVRESARIVHDAGLHVSSLCRGGFFPADTEAKRRENLDDNRRAVEQAAELGTDLVVLVCGGMAGCNLDAARRTVVDGIRELQPFAEEHGIRLGVEPLHPMFAATRSVIVTLGQALGIAAELPGNAGVVIDVYHVWWDPDLYPQIEKARGRIFGLHLSDWLDPMPDFVNGRGLMGNGVCEIRRVREAVDRAGYSGPIEIEIFNEKLWSMPADQVISLVKERYLECC